MGTKNNPGKYDCYSKADPDEPLFVLRAKDPLAPILIRLWVDIKDVMNPPYEDADKKIEALECSENMEDWRRDNG